jgi:hypothetical protein
MREGTAKLQTVVITPEITLQLNILKHSNTYHIYETVGNDLF